MVTVYMLKFRGRNLYNYVGEDERILSVKKNLALASLKKGKQGGSRAAFATEAAIGREG